MLTLRSVLIFTCLLAILVNFAAVLMPTDVTRAMAVALIPGLSIVAGLSSRPKGAGWALSAAVLAAVVQSIIVAVLVA